MISRVADRGRDADDTEFAARPAAEPRGGKVGLADRDRLDVVSKPIDQASCVTAPLSGKSVDKVSAFQRSAVSVSAAALFVKVE